mmetsp:Transcript_21294/g.25891  ORF Transcript_21294/g.25891 Transcript_21294/m.25891 type:complete len:83 (-) Transcript_21294:55-303(-)
MFSAAESITKIYEAELPLSLGSAFVTHGVSTWVVLLSGWITFCALIDFVSENFDSVKKFQDTTKGKESQPRVGSSGEKNGNS